MYLHRALHVKYPKPFLFLAFWRLAVPAFVKSCETSIAFKNLLIAHGSNTISKIAEREYQLSSIHFQLNPDIFRWLGPAISTVRGFDLMPRLRQKALLPSFRSSLLALGPAWRHSGWACLQGLLGAGIKHAASTSMERHNERSDNSWQKEIQLFSSAGWVNEPVRNAMDVVDRLHFDHWWSMLPINMFPFWSLWIKPPLVDEWNRTVLPTKPLSSVPRSCVLKLPRCSQRSRKKWQLEAFTSYFYLSPSERQVGPSPFHPLDLVLVPVVVASAASAFLKGEVEACWSPGVVKARLYRGGLWGPAEADIGRQVRQDTHTHTHTYIYNYVNYVYIYT